MGQAPAPFCEKSFCIFLCPPRLTAVKNVRNGFGRDRNLPHPCGKATRHDCSRRDFLDGMQLVQRTFRRKLKRSG